MNNNLESFDKEDLIAIIKKYEYALKIIYEACETCDDINDCSIKIINAIKKIRMMVEFVVY